MKKYVTYTVQILIEENSELDRRIKDLAKRQNTPPEDVVDLMCRWGISGHMERNLELCEKSYGN